MPFKFVECATKPRQYQFKGERKTGPAKQLRDDLADTLIMLAGEWNTTPIPLDEAKKIVYDCLDQVKEEGGNEEELYRMRVNVERIEDLTEMIRYAYNYKLRTSGLSVRRILRGK